MPPLMLAGLLLAQLVSAAPLPNAWQITDSLATGGALNYATNLSVRRSGQRHKLAGQSQRLDGRAGDLGIGQRVRHGPDEFPLGHFRGHQLQRG